MIKVKANSVTNLSDARYFAAMGVEWMGFDMDKDSDSFVEPEAIKEIADWVDGPKITGEFSVSHEAGWIEYMVSHLKLSAIQTAKPVNLAGVEKIILINERSAEAIEAKLKDWKEQTDYFMIKVSQELSEEKLSHWMDKFDIIADLSAVDDSGRFIETMEPAFLAVKGGEEEKVGYKSFDDLDEIFEALSNLS